MQLINTLAKTSCHAFHNYFMRCSRDKDLRVCPTPSTVSLKAPRPAARRSAGIGVDRLQQTWINKTVPSGRLRAIAHALCPMLRQSLKEPSKRFRIRGFEFLARHVASRQPCMYSLPASRQTVVEMAAWFRNLARRAMFRARAYIAGRPHLDAFTKDIIARVPLLDRRVRAVVRAEREDRYQAIPVRATRIGTADLTPWAHKVYLDLVRALRSVQ